MLKKQQRLNIGQAKGLKFVFNNKYFTVKIKENGLLFFRVGVIISSRVLPSAVKRNNLKREIFRFGVNNEIFKRFNGKDLLIICLPAIVELVNEGLSKNGKKKLNEELKNALSF